MDGISPELVLIDPALGHAARSVARPSDAPTGSGIDAPSNLRLAPEAPSPGVSGRERAPVLTIFFLVSLLTNGFLTSYVLFGRHAERPPAVVPTAQPQAVAPSADAVTPAPPVPPELRHAALQRAVRRAPH